MTRTAEADDWLALLCARFQQYHPTGRWSLDMHTAMAYIAVPGRWHGHITITDDGCLHARVWHLHQKRPIAPLSDPDCLDRFDDWLEKLVGWRT